MFVKKNKKTTVCDEIEIYTMIKIMGLMRNYDNLFTFICSHIFLLNKKIVFSYPAVTGIYLKISVCLEINPWYLLPVDVIIHALSPVSFRFMLLK